MHLVLTGASGHVGSGILAYLLSMKERKISKLTILTRRKTPLIEEAALNTDILVKIVPHQDFRTYSTTLLESLGRVDSVIWALGISQNEVHDEEEYAEITKTFPLAASNAFMGISSKLNFVYISAEGTSTEPGLFSPLFARVKGQTEESLLQKSNEHADFNAYSVRLGFIDHTGNTKALQHAQETRSRIWLRIIDNVLTPIISTVWRNVHTPTADMARVILDLAVGDGKPLDGEGVIGGGRTLRNFGIRRLAGLSYDP